MDNQEPACCVFNTHVEAEEAIRSLGRSGFDVKKLSRVGTGFHGEEHPIGFDTLGDRIETVPKDKAVTYETALKVDPYLLVVHGSAKDDATARSLLERAKAVG